MAGIDYEGYINAILPSYLQNDAGKNLMKGFSNQSEELFLNAQSARKEGMIVECSDDDVIYHFANASALVSPFENIAEQRAYLKQKFENWKKGGTVEQMKAELARFGYKNTKVVTWSDLIKMGVEHPFGGGFTKIVGLDINGGMTYIPKREDTVVVVEHMISGVSQPLVVYVIGSSPGTKTVTIQLQTDAGGFPISKPIEIYKALAKAGVDAYLGYGWLGTGLGTAVGSPPKTLPMGFHSFFYLDIETPNGFGDPFLWNDNTVSYSPHISGTPAKRWRDFTLPTLSMGEEITAVWGNLLENIWVGTNQGKVFRWNGSMWTSIPTGVTYAILDIFGVGSTSIWMVGDSSNALYWNGLTFTSMSIQATPGGVYNKLYGAINSIWAVGNGGKIAFWNGVSWTQQPSGTTQDLLGVYGFGATDVWAVGKGATILRYDGVSWSAVVHTITGPIQCVWGAESNKIWFGLYQQDFMGYWNGVGVSLVAIENIQDFMGANVVSVKHIVGLSDSEVFAFNSYTQIFNLALGLGAFFYNGTTWNLTTTFINANNAAVVPTSSGSVVLAAGKDPVDLAHPVSMLKWEYETTGTWSDFYKFPAGEEPVAVIGSSDTSLMVPVKNTMTNKVSSVRHWDGSSWSLKSLPYEVTQCVAWMATSSTDAWITGGKPAPGGGFVILRWNGTTWAEMINLGSTGTNAFWANGPNDAWVAFGLPLQIKHWDGTIWSSVAPPMGADNCSGIWGEGTNKMLFSFSNGASTSGFISKYQGVGFNTVFNFTTKAPLKISGVTQSRFFVLTRDGMAPFDLRYSFIEHDGATGSSYEYPLKNFSTSVNTPYISAKSDRSMWCADFGFSASGPAFKWNGVTGENISYVPPTNKIGILATGEETAYQVENTNGGMLRVFKTISVLLPSSSTGKRWNDGGAWDGQPPYPAALRDLRKIVRKYKPATTSGRFARIQIGAMSIPYSIGESYEEDAYGNLRGPYLSSYLTR